MNTVILDPNFLYNCYRILDSYGSSLLLNYTKDIMLPLYFNLNMFIQKGVFDKENVINEKCFYLNMVPIYVTLENGMNFTFLIQEIIQKKIVYEG